MKRHFTSIVTVAALVLGAGCGKKNDTPPAETTPAAETAQPATAEPATAEPAKAEPDTAKPTEAKEDPQVTPPPAANDPLAAPADVAAPPADAEKTASGLVSKVLVAGTGTEHPSKRDTVKVHYTGWTKDGNRFDSSVARGEPTEFPLNAVIPGWTEGVQLMVVGEKRRFWIPGNLAYGDTPRRPGAPAGQLTFDVELLGITKAPTVPAPADVAGPPADATKTESGLAYKVVKKGEGDGAHPAATDRVTVHYSGWTTDGELFDSSVLRGSPATFPLNGVIPGWTEGVQLMSVGDTFRFWIPGNLAYGDTPKRPGAPAGMLVFDVELIKIN
ncbi:MAG: FKBP-type peptidyl-prolyl cis-trans isomerase [Deltaproteobacteria bacterium]|nr:MAG: FKBP-type peptidyl-prolyl cis-trans isomerase [Deltaproteobacteria bacterium]